MRNLRNEGFQDVCASTNIIHVMKSWRKMWMWHVTCGEEEWNVYRVVLGRHCMIRA